MPSSWTVYHNPRCSKSRAALQVLHDAGIEPSVVEYLKDTPTAAELDTVFKKLGSEPQAVMRFGEPIARELGLHADDARSRAEWIRLIVEHPILLERPIVIHGSAARVGRPPERVRELL